MRARFDNCGKLIEERSIFIFRVSDKLCDSRRRCIGSDGRFPSELWSLGRCLIHLLSYQLMVSDWGVGQQQSSPLGAGLVV